MKIVVISDTHGEIDECISIINSIDDLDLVIHLGDYSSDAKIIKESVKADLIAIKGNCDVNEYLIKDELVLTLNDKKIFITHGHNYNVKRGIDTIYYKAKELEVDIVLFGHSHIPLSLFEDNVIFLNPGSISYPRGGHKKSYAELIIKDNISSKIIYV